MTKMTAEQVADALDKVGRMYLDELARSAYFDAAAVVREHLIETDEQRRERFESWFWWLLLRHKDAAELNGADESKRDAARQMTFVRDSDGSYGTYGVEEVWMAWQAALTWRGEMKRW